MKEGFSMEEYDAPQDVPAESPQSDEAVEVEIVPLGEVAPEASLERAERRQEIMSEARERRAEIFQNAVAARLKEVAEAPLARKALNFLPVVGDAFLLSRAAKGKEGHRELTKKQRAVYAVAATCSVAATACIVAGEKEVGGSLKVLADILQHAEALPMYARLAAEQVANINPRLASALIAAGGFLAAKKAELIDMQHAFDSALVTLNLHEEEPR